MARFEINDRAQTSPNPTPSVVPNMDEVARLGSARPSNHHASTEQMLSGDVFPNTSIGRDRSFERTPSDAGAAPRHPFHNILSHIENSVYKMHNALKSVGKGGGEHSGEGGKQHACPFVSVAQKVGFTPKSKPHGEGS